MGKKKRRKYKKSKWKKWLKKNKVIVILILSALFLFFFFFGAKTVLYINFLLGNDIVVKLNVDKADISLLHGQEENISFEASVKTNPFCTSECESTFKDISKGNFIEHDKFILKPRKPLLKQYIIKPTQLGTGQNLYRFDMECYAKSTVLCNTDEQPTTRSILITVKYDLTEEEKLLKNNLKEQLGNLTQTLSELQGTQLIFNGVVNELNKTTLVDKLEEELIYVQNKIDNHIAEILLLKEIWEKQDYYMLEKEFQNVNNEVKTIKKKKIELNNILFDFISSYNVLIQDMNTTKGQLEELKDIFLTNQTFALEINRTIEEFNNAVTIFKNKNTITEKEIAVNQISNKTKLLQQSISQEIKKETLRRELELDVSYDALCEVNGLCIQHPSIEERANQTLFELNKACAAVESLKGINTELNNSMQNASVNLSYPNEDAFWENISLKVKNIKQNIINNYLDELPENATNTELIKELVMQKPLVESGNYPNYNLTPALVIELVKQQPQTCDILDITLTDLKEFDINGVEVKEITPINLGIIFEEPLPKCCVFGKCNVCCITEDCINNPLTFPVVLLHGHAVNKDVSAEYSLEGFNKIQKKLEDDGYISAGTITLYTTKDSPEGVWGLPGVPLTIRASYYFDIFKQPDNYVVVQTKSENIDTYAIRLKELIDTIKYKTGKPKVNLVAFSMGGLVARRYIQIFGTDNVEKLILIGVPNKGIVGNIADYCPIIGEKRECKDMNADSLFINKLNRGPLPNIPIYNIVGTGCRMGDKLGDGAVLEDHALLEGVNNYVINGTCSSKIKPLHLDLRDTDLYPKTYEIIINALKE